AYLCSLVWCSAIPLGVEAWFLTRQGAGALAVLGTIAATVIPASVAAAAAVHWIFARVLVPSALPKLDFSNGIPEDARTLVVVPALLGPTDEVEQLVGQLELHYLANPDPTLQFALLTDQADSTEPPRESALV